MICYVMNTAVTAAVEPGTSIGLQQIRGDNNLAPTRLTTRPAAVIKQSRTAHMQMPAPFHKKIITH